MTWSLHRFDVTTGVLTGELPMVPMTWTRTIGDSSLIGKRTGGQGDSNGALTFPASSFARGGVLPTPVELHNQLMPLKVGVALLWGETPWIAGIIGDRTDTREQIAFPVHGIWPAILSKRLVASQRAEGLARSVRVLGTGLGRGTLAKRAVQAALDQGPLPITFDPDEEGEHELAIPGFDLANADAATVLRRLMESEGGPDLDFRPQRTAENAIGWHLYAGREAYPHIRQVTTRSLSESMVVDLRQVVSSSRITHRVYGTGAGSGEGILLSKVPPAAVAPPGWPFVETVVSDTSAETQAEVDAIAWRHHDLHHAPLAQWEATVRMTPEIPHTSIWPGDLLSLNVAEGFPTIEPGAYTVRVMEMSGDESDMVRFKFDVTPAIF